MAKDELADTEKQLGYSSIAVLCVESEATPAIGGDVDCNNTSGQTGAVRITRYVNLQDRPDVQSAVSASKQLIAKDILALNIKSWQEPPNAISNVRVLNTSQPYIIRASESGQNYAAINATFMFSQVPPQSGVPPLLQGLYNSLNPSYEFKEFGTYLLAPDGNTAYQIVWGVYAGTPVIGLPLPIRVIMSSFQPLR